MEEYKVPTHVGLIVDGNGRWAKSKGLSRSKGHEQGSKRLSEIVPYMFKCGVKIVSAYIFSTENFKREQKEVDHLMDLFIKVFKKNINSYNEDNIKVIFSGGRNNLREDVLSVLDEVVEKTKNNDGGIINFCFNYGGRSEIVNMVKTISSKVDNQDISLDDIDEEMISEHMYQNLPDIDLLIRTSGEKRVSNFMLYQLSYSEFYFPDVLFPDFSKEEFDKALDVYNNRDRRFGGIKK